MTLARRIAGEGSFYTAVIVLVTFAAFPFYWMLITTFKTDGDLYNLKFNPYWFNAAPTLEHLRYLFEETLFAQWLWNTALIGVCVVAITIAIFAFFFRYFSSTPPNEFFQIQAYLSLVSTVGSTW
jgi:multiple sugar transport system permease protein